MLTQSFIVVLTIDLLPLLYLYIVCINGFPCVQVLLGADLGLISDIAHSIILFIVITNLLR